MAYTPELSYRYSCILRRIAWALHLPMTKAIEAVFDRVVNVFDSQWICESFRDKSRCNNCAFYEKEALATNNIGGEV